MDSLTHLLMGHTMGTLASSVSPEAGAAIYWAALIGNSLPDLDVPVSLVLRRGISLHRTATHTVAGSVVMAAITAAGLHRFYPAAGLGQLFLWTLLGCLAHIAVDCLNLFGVRPFWPLNGRSVDLGVLHILDPFLLVLLGLPTVGGALGLVPQHLAGAAFLGMWPYVAYRLVAARRLLGRLRAEGSLRARVIPWFNSWRYIFETHGTIEFGRWYRGVRLPMEVFPKRSDPRIEASRSDPRVSQFLRSAEYPIALIQGEFVIWIDGLRRMRADFQPLRVRL